MSGHLIVTEDSSDGEAVRMGTWRLDHLVHLAKLYDQEKFGEKYDKRITELEAKIIDMQRDIHSLIAGSSRIPRFGWRQNHELAASIMPGIAPYRACPKCGDIVPLTQKNCAVCGQEMSDVKKWTEPTQEDGGQGEAPFPG